MSDSEFSETLDVNGQDESEVNKIHMQLLQQRQQYLTKEQQQEHQNVNYMSYAGSTSSSGESSISSTSSDESDEGDTEDSLELAKIKSELLNLPRGLCENVAVFQEFFSLEMWQELPLPVQNHLRQFLPRFDHVLPTQLAAVEQNRTISMLFNNELTRFGQAPLMALQQQLEIGNYRPDIIKLRESILKSQRRELRFQHCERLSQMAKQLFISRQRLLDIAYKSSPDTIIKSSDMHSTRQPKSSHLFTDNTLSAMRARKRFYSEISQIAQQLGMKDDVLSADEDDDDGLIAEELKKDQQLKNHPSEDTNDAVKTSTALADRCVYSTLFKKQKNVEDEEALRLQQKAKQAKLTNRNFREHLREHKRRKITEPTLPEFETSDIRLRDVCARAQMGGNFKRMFAFGKTPGRKPKITPTAPTTPSACSILTTSDTSAATNPTVCNMLLTATTTNATTTTTTQPITLKTLAPPPLPPSKLSEPPALVPIQSKLKKAEAYQIITSSTKSPRKEYFQHQTQKLQQSFPTSSLNNTHNTSDTLNIGQLLSVGNHAGNLNLCIDDSSLLTGDHDAFNMLDNEVELQQEEVETFGSTCEETIPAFVIGNEATTANNCKNDGKASLMNARNQHQQMGNIQPVPKLEPISRTSLINAKPSPSVNSSANVSELIQETHACYFSLIRDFFCSTTNHRMRYDDLRNKIDVWLRNPITALNEWYSLSENWSILLKSAISFLVGEFADLPDEYVPYIEHKVQLNIYQWIGAGRDSDARLSELCTLWMEKRKLPSDKQHSISSLMQNEMKFEMCSRSSVENDESHEDDGGGLSPPPPPPRCPTSWSVRAATLEEISEFQRQERERFENPHRSYTYRMHGYESVVGPVKGIYSPLLALSKARGHSMMVGDRPNFVTILTLVRDATARLPNGEGTRAEISELLKCSQYINRDASENVLQTIVSGALDRMHTEHDPCVRYDPRRKIWIYIHRNRSEEEFERVHQHNQTIGKAKKLPQRKPKLVSTMGKLTSLADNNNFSLVANTETSGNSTAVTGTLLTMPALVPSNPIIVTNNNTVQRQQQVLQQHIINTNKCPPVPPLKYNIPPTQSRSIQQQQQQKSLLKTTIRTENKINQPSSSAATNTSFIKQHNFQLPQTKNGPNQNTTPIIVATPQGLQTVHVSNATTVMSSQTANQQQQLQLQQASSAQQHSNITANLTGKRVTLSKPIIFSQVKTTTTSATPAPLSTPAVTSMVNQKIKSPQTLIQKTQLIQNRITLQTNQHQLLTQQQQQSNLIIPISMANNMSLSVHQSSNITETNINSSTPQVIQSANNPSSISLSNKQNIIRLVPASNVKSLMNSPTTSQIVSRQRLIASTATTERPATPQHQQKAQTGLHLLSNNANTVTVTGAVSNQVGSIVKMSPQQFASLQQKQGQQQHIIVKQPGVTKTQASVMGANKPQRVILGNTAIVNQTGQAKNIVLQHIPVASSSVVVAPNQTSTSSSITGTLSGSNKIQTINAKNLTPQQQRILIQNLKQQQQQQQQQQTINQNQIQFKTVQVVGNTSAAQRPQTVTLAATQQTVPKGIVVVSRDNGTPSQQNVTRILKTTSPQLKSELSASAAGNRVITSSTGQIISLDSLIQKQGGTLRITGTGNAAQTIKSNQQHHITTNILQKSQPQMKQQQQAQQFAIVSVPNSIISLSNNSNFTVNQRIITTQAGSCNTTSLVNFDTTRVTPSIVSTGSGRVITATAAGTKIITKQSPASVASGNIRVINTVNQTGNINLATLQGKQVVLAGGKTLNTVSKAQLQTQQQQNIVQTQQGSIVIGGQTVKLQQGNTNIQQLLQKSGNIISSQQASASNQTTSSSQLQTVIMGNQILRVQQIPQIVPTANRLNVSNSKAISSNINSSITTANSNAPKTIFVGSAGQALRLQTASSQAQTIANKNIIVQSQHQTTTSKTAASVNATTPNRVVLAVQGGGQIFLSPNFQGGNINLKSLQNMKVVSLAQHSSVKLKESASSTLTSPSSSTLSTQKNIFKATTTATPSDTNI